MWLGYSLAAYFVVGVLCGEAWDWGRKQNGRPFSVRDYLFMLALWPVFVVGFAIMKIVKRKGKRS